MPSGAYSNLTAFAHLQTDLTERKHKWVEREGSLGCGKPQILRFKILNVLTSSKCAH